MSTARRIIEERLAKGEISEEEYDRLLSKLSATSDPEAPNTPEPPVVPVAAAAPAAEAAGFLDSPVMKVFQWIGGVVIVLFIIGLFNGGGASKNLDVGNVSGSGTTVTFRVANSGSSQKDALFWIEQNGIEKCNRKKMLRAKWSQTVSMRCNTLRTGNFTLKWAWASSDTKRSNISTRLK